MQNNIKIRNLYIGKVQKQINKLMYSVNLLNNLNNVIDNQYGGANLSVSTNIDDKNKEAQQLVDQAKVNHKVISFTSLSMGEDTTTKDLEATIKILTNFIEELKNKLSTATDPTEIIKLNDNVKKLESDLATAQQNLKDKQTELDNKNKELETVNEKMVKFENDLIQYNKILDELKKLVPQVQIHDIQNYNNLIDTLIKKFDVPPEPNISNQSQTFENKIKAKYTSVFDIRMKDNMLKLQKDATNLKIINTPNVQITNDDGIKYLFTIPMDPYVAKNQKESDAINEFVTKEKEKYTTFTTINKDIIDKINEYRNQIKRIDTVMRPQNIKGKLDDAFKDFNEYFFGNDDIYATTTTSP